MCLIFSPPEDRNRILGIPIPPYLRARAPYFAATSRCLSMSIRTGTNFEAFSTTALSPKVESSIARQGGTAFILSGRSFYTPDSRFALSSKDSLTKGVAAGLSAVRYSVDAPAGPFADYAAPFSLPEGTHTVTYFGLDRVANAEKLRVKSYNIATPASAPGMLAYAFARALEPGEAAEAAASGDFALGEVYAFPNPARSPAGPVLHVEAGYADSLEVRLYDIAGDLKRELRLTGAPQLIDDGQGPQFAYEAAIDTRGLGSGMYVYVVRATKAGSPDLRASGKLAIVK